MKLKYKFIIDILMILICLNLIIPCLCIAKDSKDINQNNFIEDVVNSPNIQNNDLKVHREAIEIEKENNEYLIEKEADKFASMIDDFAQEIIFQEPDVVVLDMDTEETLNYTETMIGIRMAQFFSIAPEFVKQNLFDWKDSDLFNYIWPLYSKTLKNNIIFHIGVGYPVAMVLQNKVLLFTTVFTPFSFIIIPFLSFYSSVNYLKRILFSF